MKKDTKKMLLVLFLAFTMFFSSVAFIFIGFAPLNTQQTDAQSQLPDTFVLDGRLEPSVANDLISRGGTLMEWHYLPGCCDDVELLIDSLPSELEYQIIVQKISDGSAVSWARAQSLRGNAEWNTSSITDVLLPLCDVLLKPPVECGLARFGNSSVAQ